MNNEKLEHCGVCGAELEISYEWAGILYCGYCYHEMHEDKEYYKKRLYGEE